MTTSYTWTPDDEAQWQRFTKGVADYGTDKRNAGRCQPARASDVIAMFKSAAISVAPWAATAASVAFIFAHL